MPRSSHYIRSYFKFISHWIFIISARLAEHVSYKITDYLHWYYYYKLLITLHTDITIKWMTCSIFGILPNLRKLYRILLWVMFNIFVVDYILFYLCTLQSYFWNILIPNASVCSWINIFSCIFCRKKLNFYETKIKSYYLRRIFFNIYCFVLYKI